MSMTPHGLIREEIDYLYIISEITPKHLVLGVKKYRQLLEEIEERGFMVYDKKQSNSNQVFYMDMQVFVSVKDEDFIGLI